MKLRFLLVSALALAFMVPAALASDSTDGTGSDEEAPAKVEDTKKNDHAAKAHKAKKYKKHAMKKLCRPRAAVVVRGDLVAVNAADGTFTVDVDKANRHGKRFVGKEATFLLAKWSKVRKQGKASLVNLAVGDRVKVMGRACKPELKDEAETPALYAKHVKAKTPKAEETADAKKDEVEEKTEESKDETPSDAV